MFGLTVISDALPFVETPWGAIAVSVASASIVAIAGAMIKVMVDLSSMKQNIKDIVAHLQEVKDDKDTMRWSDFIASEYYKSTASRKRRDRG